MPLTDNDHIDLFKGPPKMLTPLMWFVALISLIGTILNAHRRREGFLLWALTNAAWVAYDLHIGAIPQAALMATYLILALYAYQKWRPPNNSNNNETD